MRTAKSDLRALTCQAGRGRRIHSRVSSHALSQTSRVSIILAGAYDCHEACNVSQDVAMTSL